MSICTFSICFFYYCIYTNLSANIFIVFYIIYFLYYIKFTGLQNCNPVAVLVGSATSIYLSKALGNILIIAYAFSAKDHGKDDISVISLTPCSKLYLWQPSWLRGAGTLDWTENFALQKRCFTIKLYLLIWAAVARCTHASKPLNRDGAGTVPWKANPLTQHLILTYLAVLARFQLAGLSTQWISSPRRYKHFGTAPNLQVHEFYILQTDTAYSM